jgi:hypothetical protein
MISVKYAVDFSQYEIDFRALAESRLISRFKNKPNLLALIYAIADEWQECYDSILALLEQRTIYASNNYYLDALGRIVGQIRENLQLDFIGDMFFTPDHDGLGADRGLAYVVGGRGGVQSIPVNDLTYKNEIIGRVMSNINQTSSIPELQRAIKEAIGIDVSFRNVAGEPFCVDVVYHGTLTAFQRGFLTLTHGQEFAEGMYFCPYPATLRIRNIIEERVEMLNAPGIGSLLFGTPQRNRR